MKVNVPTVDKAIFRSKWHYWSNWIDVAIFDYESTPFLLQMQVNRANGKRFKAIRMSGKYCYRQTTCAEIGDLEQMSKS